MSEENVELVRRISEAFTTEQAEVPLIIQEAGHKSRPQAAELGGQYDS